ncbi:MAG TPA: class I SAM-dependent methyltransferase [Vicinamibacterales bacterium]|nr:class I SAM-dependent methyltransferase [Vicinamibacterales bacterium]
MTDSIAHQSPSPFVAQWVSSLAAAAAGSRSRRALDVASGRGRHALALAAAGFHVVAIDLQLDALRFAQMSALARGLTVSFACADLTRLPLPHERFDAVVVTRYLDRRLFPALRESLTPGGVLLCETFTENQLRYDRGPRSRHHLLAPGELRTLVQGLDVLFDEEVSAPEALARIAARRPR